MKSTAETLTLAADSENPLEIQNITVDATGCNFDAYAKLANTIDSSYSFADDGPEAELARAAPPACGGRGAFCLFDRVRPLSRD